jgi:penicillin-binding protein A
MEDRRVKPRRRGGLIALAVVLLILVAGLAVVTWLPLRSARAEWRAGRVAEAIVHGERWLGFRLWGNQYHQLLSAAYFTAGNSAGARAHIDALRGKRLLLSAVDKDEVANRLFARGGYADFLEYDRAVHSLGEGDDADLYRAAALLATNKPAEADAIVRGLDRDDVEPAKLRALDAAVEQRKQGSYQFLVDRDGKTIAAYQIDNGDVVAINTDYAGLIEKEAGQHTVESQIATIGTAGRIETTLDSAVQKAAMRAMSGFRGALVAIDPRTNEILAIASSTGRGPLENLALDKQYEPGSVMKVLTGMAALSSGVDVDSLFPYKCDGALPVDGRQFGDWLQGGHGSLPDFDEALAESCNVVFADLGVRVGVDRLRPFHTRAGFDQNVDLGLFRVPLGFTVGRVFNKFETAFYSIGLEHESSSVLHLAMIATMAANRGVMTSPKLIQSRRSILGEDLGGQAKLKSERVVAPAIAERMVKAMVAVANRPKGTGRRAPIDGVSLAIKTGTAGERAEGYQAAIIAFAPVEGPKIAFALVAEESGPAEFAAAKIVHEFLAAIRPRL